MKKGMEGGIKREGGRDEEREETYRSYTCDGVSEIMIVWMVFRCQAVKS